MKKSDMPDAFFRGWLRRGEKTRSKHKCGNCEHVNNDLGFVALHCDILPEHDDLNKVRSWNGCAFKPSRWVKLKVRE